LDGASRQKLGIRVCQIDTDLQSRRRASRIVWIGGWDGERLLLVFTGAGCLGFILESPVVIERVDEKRNSRIDALIECESCRVGLGRARQLTDIERIVQVEHAGSGLE